MLSGIKFVPRDNLVDKGKRESRSDSSDEDYSRKKKRNKDAGVKGERRKNEKYRRNKQSKKRRTRYSTDESGSDSSDDSKEERKLKRCRKGKKSLLVDENDSDYSSEASLSDDDDEDGKGRVKSKKTSRQNEDDLHQNDKDATRMEIGLDWMLRPGSRINQERPKQVEEEHQDHQFEQIPRTNPRELNPYLKDNGSGYPDDSSVPEGSVKLLSSSVIGDGGASWRLKALKRAKEQAAREGKKLQEIVEERWGSLGQLAESVAASEVAPAHAHLHAIKDRRRGQTESSDAVVSTEAGGVEENISGSRDYLRDISSRNSQMRKPRQENLSWKRNKGPKVSEEERSLISGAISDINQFANDGSFMGNISHTLNNIDGNSSVVSRTRDDASPSRDNWAGVSECSPKVTGTLGIPSVDKPALTANQLAAKVLQLRMKGKHEEADKLSKEAEAMAVKQDAIAQPVRPQTAMSMSRHSRNQTIIEEKRRKDDADLHLAKTIMQNKQFSLSGREEDEYGFDVAPSKKAKQRKDVVEEKSFSKRFLTQQERCQFCFENSSRPKHLVVSIANFTYLMLPQWQPVVQGHCYILPMQHAASTRTVDKNVWEEIRNFKKCLLKMFARDDKDVVFLETAIGLSKQHRHCLLECIPVPSQLSKQAPMYFKKAIDEAEEEWGQHDSKKVIPTNGSLRQVIPENFSYFHVEFGLDRGFVHVIDNDSNFSSGFGLNVIRGMLHLPEEDMFRRRRQEPLEIQQQAVARFAKEWEPFDWTKQLD